MSAPASFAAAYQLLSYDPETGRLRWKEARGTRAKPGEDAGTLTPQGYIIVTLEGKKYLGHYLAWLLYHGEWPQGRLKLVSTTEPDLTEQQRMDRRQDIRIANIAPAERYLSRNPNAQRQRHIMRDRAYRARVYEAHLDATEPSRYDNVRYDRAHDHWVVYSFPVLGKDIPVLEYKLFAYPFRKDAEAKAYEMLLNRAAMTDGADEVPPPILSPEQMRLPAGLKGPHLGDIAKHLAYEPYRGALFWREGSHKYCDATQATHGKTLFVQFKGWKLPAHSVAYFLTHKVWPKRGDIHPLDNNWHNLALTNLFYTPKDGVQHR